ASYVRFQTEVFDKVEVDDYAYVGFTILVTLLWALVVEHLRLNRIVYLVTVQPGVKTAALATLYCMLLSLSLLFCYRSISFSRGFVFVGCSLMFVLSFCLIHLFRAAMYLIDKSQNGRFPVAVLGADEFAVGMAERLSKSRLARCKVACFIELPGQNATAKGSPVLAWDRLDDVVDIFHCREIIVALPPERMGQAQTILQTVQHL